MVKTIASDTIALLREVSPQLPHCELTHVQRVPINLELARTQHKSYAQALTGLGASIEWLPPLPGCPDGVFVEDMAIALPELAVIARPGTASRVKEVDSVATALERHRRLVYLSEDAHLDGGDVLVAGKRVYVGNSTRTNKAAARDLARTLAPHGYEVSSIYVTGCLHLKTACTFIPPGIIVINAPCVDPSAFRDFEVIEVDENEASAANTLTLGGTTLVSSAFPKTEARLRRAGVNTRALDISELQKAEAGLSCLSVLLSGVRPAA